MQPRGPSDADNHPAIHNGMETFVADEHQFQQGRATLRDLESAQLDQNDKWMAFLDADFAYQQTQLDLLRTTGQVAQLFQ